MNSEKKLDDRYIKKINKIDFNPIFILGLPRSGTTILYTILGETKKFNIVTAYHVLNYDRLIYDSEKNIETKRKKQLNKIMQEKGLKNRKMDEISVTADYAQEYASVFTKRGYPSKITTENKWLFDNLCKKIQYTSKNSKYILLKNPPDYPNFIYLKNVYPKAKFIFIHRNPLNSISSMIRALNMILNKRSEYNALFSKEYSKLFNNPILHNILSLYYSTRLPIGIFEIIKKYKKDSEYFLKNINRLSKKDFISINYEDLCYKPNVVIGEIMDFLGYRVDMDFTEYISPRDLKLIPIVKFLRGYIYKTMIPYYRYLGYDI